MQPLQHEDLVEDIVFPTHGNLTVIRYICQYKRPSILAWNTTDYNYVFC